MKEIIRAYKYRIYPNKKQRELIDKTFGCCRFVYNFCRGNQKKEENMWLLVNEMVQQGYFTCNNYKSKFFNKFENYGFLKELKQYYKWLKEVDKFALESAVDNLADAYNKYYKKQGGKPKFKSKKNNDVISYTTKFTNNNIEILGKHIKLPKLKAVKFKDKSRPQGKIVKATISKTSSNRYYVSLTCKEVLVQEYPKTNNKAGIDLGIADFAILSNGKKICNNQFLEKELNKIAELQRGLSRKSIGSSNYNKAKLKVAKIHEKIANQRNDFLHKLTHKLIKEYDIICIENLDVKEMKETDSTIRNLRVSDVSWYEFRRQLEYKADWYGKTVSKVNRYYPSSQICSCCGHRDSKKDTSIREWICPKCNNKLDRDLNASINILNEGLRLLNFK